MMDAHFCGIDPALIQILPCSSPRPFAEIRTPIVNWKSWRTRSHLEFFDLDQTIEAQKPVDSR